MNYNQNVSRLSRAGANTIQYQSGPQMWQNQMPSFQDDMQTLQMLSLITGQRRTGLESAESMLMSRVPHDYQQMTQSYIQPSTQTQLQPLRFSSNSRSGSQLQQNKYGDRVLQFVERQNQILQQLGTALVQQRQPSQISYQPIGQSQTQLPQLNPTAPPPIYLPPHLQKYANKEEKEIEVTEKIRLLLMLKKVRDENLILKQKLRQKVQKKIQSEQQPEQPTEEQVQIPSRAQSVSNRNFFDLQKENEILADLKGNRGRFNLRKLKIVQLMIRFIRIVQEELDDKKETFLQNFLDDYVDAINSINSWVKPMIETVNSRMNSTKNFACCITTVDEVKVSESAAKKNFPSLQQIVKAFIDQIVDNVDTFPNEAKEFLARLTGNLLVAPQNYFFKFELSRLNFNQSGGIINPTLFKGQMIVLILVVVRSYLNEIAKLYEEPPQGAKKDLITAAQKTKSNILHIISCMHDILIEYIKGIAPQQQDNQAQIPVEFKIKPRQILIFTGYVGQAQQIYNDDILVQPKIEESKLQLFFSDRKFIQNMQALFENLGTNIYESSKKLQEYDRQTNIDRYKSTQLPKLKKILTQTKDGVETIMVDRDFLIADYNTKIEAQIERIRQNS